MKKKTKLKTEQNIKRKLINDVNRNFWKKVYFVFGETFHYAQIRNNEMLKQLYNSDQKI